MENLSKKDINKIIGETTKALIQSLKDTKKKEKALEDMTEDELLEELKKTVEGLKNILG